MPKPLMLTIIQIPVLLYMCECQVYEAHYQEAMTAVNALKVGIQRVFTKIGCPDSGMLGGNAGVTESNMMQYLGLIEERANELLQIYEEQQRQEGQANPGNNNNGSDLNTKQDNELDAAGRGGNDDEGSDNENNPNGANGDEDDLVPVFPQDPIEAKANALKNGRTR